MAHPPRSTGARRRLSRPPRAGLSRRLHAVARAVAQAARGALAGRVQSVALRLVCDRELEIESSSAANIGRWSRILKRRATSRSPPGSSAPTAKRSRGSTSARARRPRIQEGARRRAIKVRSVEARPVSATPTRLSRPRRCNRKPRESSAGAAHTMRIAQRLYEGVDIGGETAGSSPICEPTASTWRRRRSAAYAR